MSPSSDIRVVEARDEHGEAILGLAGEDPVLNAFIIYDWLELRDRCRFYLAIRGPSGRLEALCAVYPSVRFDSIIPRGSPEGIKAILAKIEPEKAVFPVLRPEDAGAVLDALGPRAGPIYNALLMACSPGDFRPAVAHDVVKLGPGHAGLFRRFLLEERSERGHRPTLEQARERLGDERRPVFAIIRDGRIVSLALIFLSTPDVAFVGGVYTVPELRNRGLATSVTSMATEEALRLSGLAALIVRADNAPAIRVYEKVGYRPYRRIKWVCVGVDYPP